MNASTPNSKSESPDPATDQLIQRLGGRHLIFRRTFGKRPLWAGPSALISDFQGPVWAFYGLGQVWLTHQQYRDFDGWTARVSRWRGRPLIECLDTLESNLTRFTHFCNQHGIEGTLVLEPQEIEFHWTFGYWLNPESSKPQHASVLADEFKVLATAFAPVRDAIWGTRNGDR